MSRSYCAIRQLYQALHVRFVDRDMLMRFHFGLGVGHVYSHHRAAHIIQQDGMAAQYHVGEADDDDTAFWEDDKGSQDEEEDDDDDDTPMNHSGERWYGSSQESLVEQFEEMYESELALDYEN